MNIKSLLLGSAAALVAVSGVQAADAVVVAEPEPAEYVRICDVYGAGYFYIPGTETCLRIGGYVRMDISGGDANIRGWAGVDANDARNGKLQGTYGINTRFALQTYTGQETELGTLKTFTETRFDWTNAWHSNRIGIDDGDYLGTYGGGPGTSVTAKFAWIQLGGLRLGKDESAYDTFNGYAGAVINDTLVPYGDFDTNLISYTFDAGNGFSAIVSLEQGSGNQSAADLDGDGIFSDKVPNYIGAIDSYMPHVVAGVKYTQGWGGVSLVGAYDSNYGTWAGKARLDVNATEQLSLWIMGGYGEEDFNPTNPGGQSFYKPWTGNWAVWGGGTYKVNEKTSLNAQLSYDEGKTFGLAANVSYDIVPGFNVTAEVDYFNSSRNLDIDRFNKVDGIGGIVRFQRSF